MRLILIPILIPIPSPCPKAGPPALAQDMSAAARAACKEHDHDDAESKPHGEQQLPPACDYVVVVAALLPSSSGNSPGHGLWDCTEGTLSSINDESVR